jgi:ligand-binding sensor domain-containing protein
MCSLRTPTILLGFLLCCGALRAQYTQLVPTNGPNGARVAALVTDREGALYAGTYEGLYRSTDNGERWTRLRTAVDPVNVNGLAVDSTNTIEPISLWGLAHDSSGHVLVGGVAVVHVVDGDDSVTSIRRGIEGRTVSSIVVASDGTVYVGIRGGGVLRLADSSDVSAAPADVAVCRDVLDVSASASGGSLAVRMRSKASTEASLELFTATGRSVARLIETTPATGVGILRMPLGDLPAGWYMLRVRCGERIATRPVIISE